MEHSERLADRLAAQRFRNRRREFAAALRGLLGVKAPDPLDDATRAAQLCAEYAAGYKAAAPSERALVSAEWSGADADDLVETVDRLARSLGPRRVWLLKTGKDAQAAAADAETALDNPLGFAAVTEHRLALADADGPAGLALTRHSHHFGPHVSFRWELEVWDEPWLSAATRALRGVG